MRVSSHSGDVEGEGFPRLLRSAPWPPYPPSSPPQKEGARGGAPKGTARAWAPGFRGKKNRSPVDETGGSVRRHREAESPARRAARGEGAAVRSRPHPQRRRPVQRASWAHRAPAPPCGRVLAGCGAAPPGGAGLPIFQSEPGYPLCACVWCAWFFCLFVFCLFVCFAMETFASALVFKLSC